MKKHTISELNRLYNEAIEADKEVYAEQRSNLQLVAGEHYNKRNTRYWDRIRQTEQLSTEQKLRLTKNHIYKASKIRKNVILSHAAGVTIIPANETELQDQKSAELNKAVWEYAKNTNNMRERVHEWVDEFFDIGEVATKIYFDPRKGRFLGYKQAVDENGAPQVDENGQMVASEDAVFSGDLVFEKVYGFNLFRHPSAKTMDESPFLGIRKMVMLEDLKAMVKGDEEKEKMISQGKDDTYVIFDTASQSYAREQGITTLREYYWRPCPEYPKGWYQITIEGGILFEDELPFGIFPIRYKGHDRMPTTPRHRSPIKQWRPVQIEINRASSKVAEHQITLGDDKIVTINGSKMTKGSEFPGVRQMTVTGQAPVVIQGRSGEQYFPYIESQITELYNLAQVPEETEEQGKGDPWGELFKASRHKKKFIVDAEKFEFFLKDVCITYLDLARNYYDENTIVEMVGRNERINISEFKNTRVLSSQIKAEPMSDDIETMMGKQLSINHILQYAGQNLQRDDIGKLIRMMPYANKEKSFEDFTLNYDRGTNIILMLDRGDVPTPNNADDGPYIIKRLVNRQVQADYQFLDPQIQANYDQTISIYEELEAEKMRKIKAAEADFIPTDGPMIKVAWYVKDPTNPKRSVQATLPANAINWLVQRLGDQGNNQEQLMSIQNQGALASIAEKYNQGQMSGAPGQQLQLPGGM